MAYSSIQREKDFKTIQKVIGTFEPVDRFLRIGKEEFERRTKKVVTGLAKAGIDIGIVFCDEHYNGDVPYLGGNTNISVEQVAGAVGRDGFHLIAGLEGGYVAEQLAMRSGCKVHKTGILQLADEKYPVEAEKIENILSEANGGQPPRKIGLLTPRQVIPLGFAEHLYEFYGRENIVDAQEIYYRIKYEKSDMEMKLIEDASRIACAAMEGMVRVLRPGMLETEVAAWGYYIGYQLGAEEMGFDIIVGSDEANRTLIGKALNREIKEGAFVHLGVSPKRDGLTACVRRSVIAVKDPAEVTSEQKYWFDLVEEAYHVGYQKFVEVASQGLPARLQEQALVDYFRSKSKQVSQRIGKRVELELLKPYTGTHNAGYTECQEFFGAITLDSNEPLGNQIVMMLDVALRGIGNSWNSVVIPGFDYLVIENTLKKKDKAVTTLTNLPVNVQDMVGKEPA